MLSINQSVRCPSQTQTQTQKQKQKQKRNQTNQSNTKLNSKSHPIHTQISVTKQYSVQ